MKPISKSPVEQITKTALNFGPKILIQPEQVFLQTANCFATVNLKPVAPGHVLVIPKWREQSQPSISDLRSDQICEIF